MNTSATNMTVDIIILSNALNYRLQDYTQTTINTCLDSDKETEFNVLVIEQNPEIEYKYAKTVHITDEFNYNRFMNIGIGMTSGEYVCLCNNDLRFHKNWGKHIIKAMQDEFLLSASPYCPRSQGAVFQTGSAIDYGYSNGKHLSGWCIMADRFLFEIIGKIDEDFPFWFADNAYAEQLKAKGVKHALVRTSIVEHMGSKTLKTVNNPDDLTTGYVRKWIEKYPQNESAIHFKNVMGL